MGVGMCRCLYILMLVWLDLPSIFRESWEVENLKLNSSVSSTTLLIAEQMMAFGEHLVTGATQIPSTQRVGCRGQGSDSESGALLFFSPNVCFPWFETSLLTSSQMCHDISTIKMFQMFFP